MVICVDFDGTCVTHEYPCIGREIDAVPVLKRIVECGHQIILFTMRSGPELEDAFSWFKKHGIPLYGINTNPTQYAWTESPKAYGQLYIDDAGLGIPLVINEYERPFVDWSRVSALLAIKGIIT